jgi:hypothetical protein
MNNGRQSVHASPPTVTEMSQSPQRPVLTGFLALTPTSPTKASSLSSPPPSRAQRGSSSESLISPPSREHRGSSSSDSSVSDIGENGFLILTPPDRVLENPGLNKIEEEAVE